VNIISNIYLLVYTSYQEYRLVGSVSRVICIVIFLVVHSLRKIFLQLQPSRMVGSLLLWTYWIYLSHKYTRTIPGFLSTIQSHFLPTMYYMSHFWGFSLHSHYIDYTSCKTFEWRAWCATIAHVWMKNFMALWKKLTSANQMERTWPNRWAIYLTFCCIEADKLSQTIWQILHVNQNRFAVDLLRGCINAFDKQHNSEDEEIDDADTMYEDDPNSAAAQGHI
jgi:hypothetical protein